MIYMKACNRFLLKRNRYPGHGLPPKMETTTCGNVSAPNGGTDSSTRWKMPIKAWAAPAP